MTARLSGLTIGALTLEPDFDPDTENYETTTSNNTNTITATPEDSKASVTITLNNDVDVPNGTAATWESGDNTLDIKVENGKASKIYTVTVTKEEG